VVAAAQPAAPYLDLLLTNGRFLLVLLLLLLLLLPL